MLIKNNKISITILILVAITAFSCSTIFEKNLKKSSIILISPKNNTIATVLTQTFWWEELDDALLYQFQIAKPDFSSDLVLDTTIAITQFTFKFLPGRYQWRVRAKNGSSETPYATRNFEVDSTPDLSGQVMALLSPSDSFATNNGTIIFKWDKIEAAIDYRFEIHEGTIDGDIAQSKLTTDQLTHSLNLTEEGTYVWGVRAQNDFTNTSIKTRTIIFDTTNPNVPALDNPLANDTIHVSDFPFSWDIGVNNGSPITDSIYVFSDTTGLNWTTEFIKQTVNQSYQHNDTIPIGDYYWMVKSFDAAGNESGFSTVRKFIIE